MNLLKSIRIKTDILVEFCEDVYCLVLFSWLFFSPPTGKLEPTRNNQNQTVKIAFKDETVNIPLGEVSATSHNARKVIVTIRKANGLPRKHEMVRKLEYVSVKNIVAL